MFDTKLRPVIDPPLNRAAALVAVTGLSANQMTSIGLALGLLAAACVVVGWFWTALLLIVLNRLADGLDGPLARLQGSTVLGGYLDIVFDFLF
ncbi:MAG: CDP-alcohol phosphatidyltransferase family protein [Pseudomonadota bacterium]